jgi:exopolysaccharide biosynthesis polyprenyl glycosylphosphotransferase
MASPSTLRDPPEVGPDLSSSWSSEAGRLRLGLQRRAVPNLNRHLRRSLRRFSVLLVADVMAAGVAYFMTRAAWSMATSSDPGYEPLGSSILPFVLATLIGLIATGSYGPGDRRRDPGRLLAAIGLASGFLLWQDIWAGLAPGALPIHAATVGLTWLVFVTGRLILDNLVGRLRPVSGPPARAIFVGPVEECRKARSGPAFEASAGYEAVGCVDTEGKRSSESIGSVSDFSLLLASTGAETVVLCGYLADRILHTVLDAALTAGCEILTVPRAIEVTGVQACVVHRNGQVLVELTAPTVRGRQLIVKRLLDVMASFLGFLVLAPLFVVLFLGIKLDSPGPVLFRQKRIGRGGRAFFIVKFRTMRVDAEQRLADLRSGNVYQDGKLFKLAEDPRVTRLGRFLRRTSLDELPQLLNVIRGEMSLVGPRPPLPSEVALYEEHHYGRLDMTPGITGPWQVAGRNLITDFEEIVRLEREYTHNWDLAKDAAILLRTIPVVLRMQGAW